MVAGHALDNGFQQCHTRHCSRWFYMLALDDQQQAFFVGIRSTFYRIASIIGQGLLIMFAGTLESRLTPSHAWSITFALTALLFFAFFAFHAHMLPKTEADKNSKKQTCYMP